MSQYTHDVIVFIGRFQPFHIGHLEVVRDALSRGRQVLLLIGSANQARTSKNPWTYNERVAMIHHTLSHEERQRVFMMPLQDQTYNDQKWTASVQQSVDRFISVFNDTAASELETVALIGHSKDETSYYLKMFPQWDAIEHEINDLVNATDIRSMMFERQTLKYLSGVVSQPVIDRITEFQQTDEYDVLKREHEMLQKYKKAWAAAPYAPTFVTTDACVIQSGHILLIQRNAAPGEGLWALPGGFLEQNEWIVDGMLRELREETKLKVPAPVLKGSIKATRVFDAPKRSLRGRTITHAFLIELPPGPLPTVKGSDDARKAKWWAISDIKEEMFFEDHFHMIQDLLGKL